MQGLPKYSTTLFGYATGPGVEATGAGVVANRADEEGVGRGRLAARADVNVCKFIHILQH